MSNSGKHKLQSKQFKSKVVLELFSIKCRNCHNLVTDYRVFQEINCNFGLFLVQAIMRCAHMFSEICTITAPVVTSGPMTNVWLQIVVDILMVFELL